MLLSALIKSAILFASCMHHIIQAGVLSHDLDPFTSRKSRIIASDAATSIAINLETSGEPAVLIRAFFS